MEWLKELIILFLEGCYKMNNENNEKKTCRVYKQITDKLDENNAKLIEKIRTVINESEIGKEKICDLNEIIDPILKEINLLKGSVDRISATDDRSLNVESLKEELKGLFKSFSDNSLSETQSQIKKYVSDVKNEILDALADTIKNKDSHYAGQNNSMSKILSDSDKIISELSELNGKQQTIINSLPLISEKDKRIDELVNEKQLLVETKEKEKAEALSVLRKELNDDNEKKTDNLKKEYQEQIESLKTAYENRLHNLEEAKQQLAIDKEHEKENELSALRKELDDDNEKKTDNLRRAHQEQITSLKTEYENKLRNLEEEKRQLAIDKEHEKEKALLDLRKELNEDNEKKTDTLKREYQEQIENLKIEYENKQHNLEEEKMKLAFEKDNEKAKEISDLKQDYQELITNLQKDFNDQKAIYEENIRSLKEKTESLKNEMDKDKSEESERNRPFVNLLEKIIKCESMKEFSDNKNLNDIYSSYSNSPERIRDFISLVGNEYGFALDICNALKKFKKASADPKPITQEEKELIEEINKFYREREGRDQNEELLYLPKGFSYTNVSGAQIPFYEPEMLDLKDAMQNRFEYISDVYTPCFKRYGTTNPQIKATVKGRIKG